MAVNNHDVSVDRCDVGPLNISWLAGFFDAESWFFLVIPISPDMTPPNRSRWPEATFAAVFIF
jgi:hypothetical protein